MRAPVTPPRVVTPSQPRRATVAIAWIGTLALSELPIIVFVETLGVDPAPLRWLWPVAGAALVALATRWQPARPLRGYFGMLLAVIAATYAITPLLTGWVPAIGLEVVQALAVKAIFFAVAAALAALLVLGLHQRRSDVFLTPGNLRAPSSVRLPGMRRPLRWTVVGTAAAVLLPLGFATQLWMESAFPPAGVARLPGLALVILAAACCNAFAEEFIFRAAPLAYLQPVIGAGQAVLMTSVWFGLGHYLGGIPPGPVGAVQSGVLGLLLGTAMVETKGLGWPLIIHIAIDVVVFASIATAI